MNNLKLIAWHFLKTTAKGKALAPVYLVWLALVIYAAYTGYTQYSKQNEISKKYQESARQSWEANPDKHPHRMAHFGSFAFRIRHPLSMYDAGMENFTGNAVYLEAHKQNTVNFSEASFSSGLLRFGELSMSMLLQLLLPLILFFLGFDAVARQKENGTLKILLTQGANFRQIILGNSMGLFITGLLFIAPVLLGTLFLLITEHYSAENAGAGERFLVTSFTSIVFLWIVCIIAICVSATSATVRASLLKLLGLWLLMAIVIPKTLQAIGSHLHPAPGKVEFEMAVETDLLKQGDSHNPNDPHYKNLKDSVLRANKVDSVQQLSFNYSGFQMKEGERMSARVYNEHLKLLHATYERQNRISYVAAFIDPLICFRNISMAFSGTDFAAYRHFQQQAESYRYHLAQTMNELQIKYISNKKLTSDDKPYSIEREHWTGFPDFHYQYQNSASVIKQQAVSLSALTGWLFLTLVFIFYSSRKAKTI